MKRKIRAGSATIEYTLIQTSRQDVLIQALEGGLTRVYAPKHARLTFVDNVVRENAEKIIAMAESLKPAPLKNGEGLLNPLVKLGFDAEKRVILSYTRYDENKNNQLMQARLESNGWKHYQTSDWTHSWVWA